MKEFRSSASVAVDFASIRAQEAALLRFEHARNTQRAYDDSWRAFERWCAAAEADALPCSPETVRNFVCWCLSEQYRLKTVLLRLTAINDRHRRLGLPSPVDQSVKEYLRRARRLLQEPPAGKRAVTVHMVRRMSRVLLNKGYDPVAIRNRAMLLLCFAAGWRRSEIVGLEYGDVSFTAEGITLWLRHSKTDQDGRGRMVGVHSGEHEDTCPVQALREWLGVRGLWQGPLFVRFTRHRHMTQDGFEGRGKTFNLIVQRLVAAVGENARNYGAHSLRSGMITEAAKHGASEHSIMHRTGHKSSQMIRLYIRPATAFDFNPMRDVL